jgi:mono/diheme cytochrome c family protein
MKGRVAMLVAGLALGLGAPACGGDDDGTTTATDTTTEEEIVAGDEVFTSNCGSCHTLSEAGTSGTIGPNLDDISLSAEDIETQVRTGGGGMPSFEDTLSDEEIAAVSAYVADPSG